MSGQPDYWSIENCPADLSMLPDRERKTWEAILRMASLPSPGTGTGSLKTVVFSVTTTRGRALRALGFFVAGVCFATLTFHEAPRFYQVHPSIPPVDWLMAHQPERQAVLSWCSNDPQAMAVQPMACVNASLAEQARQAEPPPKQQGE